MLDSAEDLARRAGQEEAEMALLAGADSLESRSGHQRQQVWDASARRSTPRLLRSTPVDEDLLELPSAPEDENICSTTRRR